LPDRKRVTIESEPIKRLRGGVAYSILLPDKLPVAAAKPANRCDRIIEARAAFLAIGSLAAANAGYHLEFTPGTADRATRLSWILTSIGYPPKQARRKQRDLLYFKDADIIVDFLSQIGAFGAVLALEDIRAMRDTKNRIHRLVNTETANLERAANAAAAQRRLVDFLARAYGLNRLSPALREIAKLRLANPEATLGELGALCDPPISKPTAQGRFSALTRLAEQLRAGQSASTGRGAPALPGKSGG
ncbi:MAG TPA: DNA-binding protein WhiA, partial [Candidatus Dormibacteraeota bacterium]|nr:DNA-binding protein WhiA [Candidatus Dormibacteraeota bacterium]